MPRPYTEGEREKIKEDLMLCVLRLIHKKGYIHTSITDIAKAAGISKAYLYTMFPSKELLITEALKRQERMAVQKAKEIGEMQGLCPKERLTAFLEWLVSAINHTFFFLTPGEAGDVSRKLSETELEQFFLNLVRQQEMILQTLKIPIGKVDVRVFGNLIINLFMLCSSRERDFCYYQEVFDDTLKQLVQGIVHYVCDKE